MEKLGIFGSKFGNVWKAVIRRKCISSNNLETPLSRCLNAVDLTLLGIGGMAGSGIYVLTGTVIREKTGSAIFLAYLIAGIIALLNALCYAELGARIPVAGSAYAYTYVASGELLAFIIGWSVILEYVLSVASVARGWSATIDSMVQLKISNGTMDIFGRFPKNAEFLADYPDILGMCTILVLGVLLGFGAKLSANFNSFVTTINIGVILFATVFMFCKPYPFADGFSPSSNGGFLPHGFGGLISGAGTCFFAFIGFDTIAVSNEEAKDPKHSMPIATAVSVSLITIIIVLATSALVMFVPWWTVDNQAAFPAAMSFRNITWATYILGIGSLLGMSASLFTNLYSLPRIVYAMAGDGLLPSWIGYVHPKTKVPIVALAVFGIMAAILTCLCDIHTLAEFLSIGTLIAFTIVCVDVCVLRFCQLEIETATPVQLQLIINKKKLSTSSIKDVFKVDGASITDEQPTAGTLKSPFQNLPVLRNCLPSRAPIIALIIYVFSTLALAALLLVCVNYLIQLQWWVMLLSSTACTISLFCLIVMQLYNQNKFVDTFTVPFVPTIPCLTIFLNMCLIVKLSAMTWMRFSIWLLIGLIIYFSYGWYHSREANLDGEFDPLLQSTNSSGNTKSTNTHELH